jgi:hypothetical protein
MMNITFVLDIQRAKERPRRIPPSPKERRRPCGIHDGQGHVVDGFRVRDHHLEFIRHPLSVEIALRLGEGHVNPCAVNVIAPGGKDIDYLIGIHPRAGAKGGLHPAWCDQTDLVAQTHVQLARYP